MSNFLKNVIRETGNEYGTIVSDGLATADVSGYVDTGSFVFNALCSGSLYGGLPQNKITAIAGESATGKTFFLLGVCQSFLEKNVDGNIVFFESESAVTKDMIESRGIDSSRMLLLPLLPYKSSVIKHYKCLKLIRQMKLDHLCCYVLIV